MNCAIVCLRLSLPPLVGQTLPRAKWTMKSVLFCEWHRWMIDRYPSLSVTNTARGAFPLLSAHLSRNTGTHTRTRTRTDQISWEITASLSLDTHRENNYFHCLYEQTVLSSPLCYWLLLSVIFQWRLLQSRLGQRGLRWFYHMEMNAVYINVCV